MSSRVPFFLRSYLASQGSLSLPGFGRIMFDMSLSPDASEANNRFPPDSLSFRAEAKGSWDPELIDFICRETGKIRPLVMSDLNSYLEFGHELTMTSKPFYIEGIGWLQQNAQHEVTLMQEDGLIAPSEIRPQRRERPRSLQRFTFPAYIRWSSIAVVLLLSSLAAALGYVAVSGIWRGLPLFQPRDAAIAPAPAKETADLAPAHLIEKPYPFVVVLEVSSRNRALKRYADLKQWGHPVRMSTKDSVKFKLYIPIRAPLPDTARHRDSLSLFFNRKVWIETHPDE